MLCFKSVAQTTLKFSYDNSENQILRYFENKTQLERGSALTSATLAGSAFIMYRGSFTNSPLCTYTFSGLAGGDFARFCYWLDECRIKSFGSIINPSFKDLLANFLWMKMVEKCLQKKYMI
ncbi:hypothetical protein [Capnocytophaga catalasegens]|uniref:hypothetical protein n=1 Tax=Capnocytophaga catalasegens TaxID=1004260 RepID=UPI00222F924A|nr:hypothetical protein [Capnocytophaga catalasegens]